MNAATIWGVAGLALVIADLVFGSFFMLFLGAGALITAGLAWAGLIDENVTWQWLVFSVTSVAGLLLFRKKLVKAFGKSSHEKYTEHKGQVVVVTESIPHNGAGRVKYRGAEWPAKTADGSALSEGHRAIIKNTDGILLEIEKE